MKYHISYEHVLRDAPFLILFSQSKHPALICGRNLEMVWPLTYAVVHALNGSSARFEMAWFYWRQRAPYSQVKEPGRHSRVMFSMFSLSEMELKKSWTNCKIHRSTVLMRVLVWLFFSRPNHEINMQRWVCWTSEYTLHIDLFIVYECTYYVITI